MKTPQLAVALLLLLNGAAGFIPEVREAPNSVAGPFLSSLVLYAFLGWGGFWSNLK